MNKILHFIVLAALALLMACKTQIKDNKGIVLARVHDEFLYETDLSGIVPKNTSSHDSIVITRNYVNNWIKTKLMVEKARFNLTDEQMSFDKALEEYENSLIIYEYESKLINRELDTSVNKNELKTFYINHLNDFELKENIVKVFYAVVDKSMEEVDAVEEVFNLPDSLIIDSLEVLAADYNFTVSTDTSKWHSFEDIKRQIPIETYNQELFLKNKRFVKISGDNNIYMLKFVDFRISDDISPFSLVEKKIHEIILAKRKIRLTKKVRKEIFDQAALNNDFEIYYNE